MRRLSAPGGHFYAPYCRAGFYAWPLTRIAAVARSAAMPGPDEKSEAFRIPRPSYSTRVHLKRRLNAIDFRFIAAAAALAAVTVAITRYL
jgi:hypothetical protein